MLQLQLSGSKKQNYAKKKFLINFSFLQVLSWFTLEGVRDMHPGDSNVVPADLVDYCRQSKVEIARLCCYSCIFKVDLRQRTAYTSCSSEKILKLSHHGLFVQVSPNLKQKCVFIGVSSWYNSDTEFQHICHMARGY